jgi:VWFA-related protein
LTGPWDREYISGVIKGEVSAAGAGIRGAPGKANSYPKIMKRYMAAFLCCFISTSIFLQKQAYSNDTIAAPRSLKSFQELISSEKQFRHEVSVTLKLIQVYVTDNKGKPIIDLEKSDFVLVDNGVNMTITDFERRTLAKSLTKKIAEETVGQTPLPATRDISTMNRKYFLFFDFAYNNVFGLKKAREAALHFIDNDLTGFDEISIVSYSILKGLVIHEYLTTNRERAKKAISSIDARDSAGRAAQTEEEYWRKAQEGGPVSGTRFPEKTEAELESERTESKRQAQNYVLKITAFAKALRYIPGQKNIILFSTGIGSSLIYGNQAGYPVGVQKEEPRGRQSRTPRQKYDPGDPVLIKQNEEMYKELAASNCTVFTFDTRESSKPASLFTYDSETFADGSRDIFSSFGVQQDPVKLLKDDKITGLYSMSRLSKTTGGKYFSNILDSGKNLSEVGTLTGTYYVLGYPIKEEGNGQFHKISVSVKRKGCEVRAQTGYFNPKPFREYSDLEKELHLFDLALTARPLLQTPILLPMTALTYASGERRGLAMLSKITPEAIEKFLGKKVEMIGLVFDDKENLAALRRAEADLSGYRGMDIFYECDLVLPPGSYRCRFVVRDLDSGDGAVASAQALVPEIRNGTICVHTPLVLKNEGSLVYLQGEGRRAKKSVTEVDHDSWTAIYSYGRASYAPAFEIVPQTTDTFFVIIPCSVSGISDPIMNYDLQLIDSKTGKIVPVERRTSDDVRRINDTEVIVYELSIKGIMSGDYFLYVFAQEAATGSVSKSYTRITIGN